LFFYKDENGKQHLVPDDGFVISVDGETAVTIYWAWPEYLDDILQGRIVGIDETAAKEIAAVFKAHPDYFLSNQQEGALTDKDIEENETDYSGKYNEADQIIGSEIAYIAVDISADAE
jgi:hypothetical protein